MSSTKSELDAIERSSRPQAPTNNSTEGGDKRRGSSLFAPSGGGAPPMYGGSSGQGRDGGESLLVDFPGSDDDYDESDEDVAPLGASGSRKPGGGGAPANMSGPGRAAPPHQGNGNNPGYGSGAPVPGGFPGGRIPVGAGSTSAMINPTYIAASAAPPRAPPPSNEGTGDIRRNSVVLNSVAMGGLGGLIDFDDSDYEDSDDDGGPGASNPYANGSRPPAAGNPAATGGPDHRPMVGGFAAAAYEAAREYHYKNQGRAVAGHRPPGRPSGSRPNPPSYP